MGFNQGGMNQGGMGQGLQNRYGGSPYGSPRRAGWQPRQGFSPSQGPPAQGRQPINPQRGDQPWSEFEPQKPQQPPMQRGIDQMPGRPQLSGPPMMPPTRNPPVGPPPGTGGIKPSREPVPLGPPVQAPPDGVPIGGVGTGQSVAAGQSPRPWGNMGYETPGGGGPGGPDMNPYRKRKPQMPGEMGPVTATPAAAGTMTGGG